MERENGQTWVWLTALALGVTLLNAAKPITVDDPYYHFCAEHLTRAPLDPYGFRLPDGRTGMESLAPMALPYWLAGAMVLAGYSLFLCKLSLFPFVLLLVFSLYVLARRCCPDPRNPRPFCRPALALVTMLVLSPAVLPGVNLMLDVPAQALGLAAIALYLRADERGSWRTLLAAGLLAGLAMQTKYTALVVPGVFLAHALLRRRLAPGLLAAGLAGAAFLAWEGWLWATCGHSHFFVQLGRHSGGMGNKLRLLGPLVSTLGGVAPWLALLSLAALGASRRLLLAGATALGVGYALLALVPGDWQTLLPAGHSGTPRLTLVKLVFGGWGLLVCTAGLVVMGRAWYGGPGASAPGEPARLDRFLVLWLALEVAGYFALSPFPAVRRVIGIVMVSSLLGARLAARHRKVSRLAWGVAGLSAALGLGFWGVDWWEARVRRQAAEEVARELRAAEPTAAIWCEGVYPFAFYGRRAGMKRPVPGEGPRPGDWVVAEEIFARHRAADRQWVWEDALPLRTLDCYYATGIPLDHHEGPRLRVVAWRQR